MNEAEYKHIQREAQKLEESTAKLVWELEEVSKALSKLGFSTPEEAHEHLEVLEESITKGEKLLNKRQQTYDRKWMDRISKETD